MPASLTVGQLTPREPSSSSALRVASMGAIVLIKTTAKLSQGLKGVEAIFANVLSGGRLSPAQEPFKACIPYAANAAEKKTKNMEKQGFQRITLYYWPYIIMYYM